MSMSEEQRDYLCRVPQPTAPSMFPLPLPPGLVKAEVAEGFESIIREAQRNHEVLASGIPHGFSTSAREFPHPSVLPQTGMLNLSTRFDDVGLDLQRILAWVYFGRMEDVRPRLESAYAKFTQTNWVFKRESPVAKQAWPNILDIVFTAIPFAPTRYAILAKPQILRGGTRASETWLTRIVIHRVYVLLKHLVDTLGVQTPEAQALVTTPLPPLPSLIPGRVVYGYPLPFVLRDYNRLPPDVERTRKAVMSLRDDDDDKVTHRDMVDLARFCTMFHIPLDPILVKEIL